jgi:hypothetical protein
MDGSSSRCAEGAMISIISSPIFILGIHTQVIQLNPSSHVGYKLKHAALHGAQRYDEAIATFQAMLSKLDDAPDTETRSKANNSCVSMA